MDPLFSENERERVVAAIRDAEAATGAEIVPLVVLRSGPYPAAQWRGGVLAALLVLALTTLLRGLSLPSLTDGSVLAAALGMGLLGAGATRLFAPLSRALTPPDERARTVHRRALQAFVEEQVFDTRDRTGILLFVSLAERQIEVLADRGIDAQVDADAWADVSAHIRRGIEADRLTRGLLDGLDCCRRVLHEHGLETSGTDTGHDENELSDRLRRKDE